MARSLTCRGCTRPIERDALWVHPMALLVTSEDPLTSTTFTSLRHSDDSWLPFHRACLKQRYPDADLPQSNAVVEF